MTQLVVENCARSFPPAGSRWFQCSAIFLAPARDSGDRSRAGGQEHPVSFSAPSAQQRPRPLDGQEPLSAWPSRRTGRVFATAASASSSKSTTLLPNTRPVENMFSPRPRPPARPGRGSGADAPGPRRLGDRLEQSPRRSPAAPGGRARADPRPISSSPTSRRETQPRPADQVRHFAPGIAARQRQNPIVVTHSQRIPAAMMGRQVELGRS